MSVFKNITATFNDVVRQFNQDQDGMETMLVVMILAISAIVMLFVRNGWDAISYWSAGLVYDVVTWVC